MNAKGRNGYFQVDQVHVWRISHTEKPEIHIEIYSKRRNGNCAPLRIQGPEKEVRNLIGKLYDAVIRNAVHNNGNFIAITGVGTDQIKLSNRPEE